MYNHTGYNWLNDIGFPLYRIERMTDGPARIRFAQDADAISEYFT